MKYVVPGGAGFIGSHIVQELVAKKEEVVVLDNLQTGSTENIKPFLNKIEFVHGDVRDLDLLKKITKGADFISHHASLISVPESIAKPQDYYDTNINGLHNVLEAARINDVKGISFASSASVYGNNNIEIQKETSELNPESPYAITKIAGEGLCKFFNRTYGLNSVSLRYFNIFGPRQNVESKYAVVIPIFIKQMLEGKSPIVHGTGEQSRDFVFIKDIVKANLIALQAKNSGGDVFNISTGKDVSINFLVQKLNQIFDKKIAPVYTESRTGDIFKSCGCADKAKEKLGFSTETSFEEGLKETVDWFKQVLLSHTH
ncbi:NAD-dependent epimerase/dehydratase family protein [Candidatus Woesearchaeota archaeon]|nr:NAD-dependent epimerase/dehydratase family protein [Candidatus Woesearchaeota archaeon]